MGRRAPIRPDESNVRPKATRTAARRAASGASESRNVHETLTRFTGVQDRAKDYKDRHDRHQTPVSVPRMPPSAMVSVPKKLSTGVPECPNSPGIYCPNNP